MTVNPLRYAEGRDILLSTADITELSNLNESVVATDLVEENESSVRYATRKINRVGK